MRTISHQIENSNKETGKMLIKHSGVENNEAKMKNLLQRLNSSFQLKEEKNQYTER